MPCKLGTRKSVDASRQRSLDRQATLERLAADPRLRPWLPSARRSEVKPVQLQPVKPSTLTFVPFEGPVPFRFEMTPSQVEFLAGAVPRRDLSWNLEGLNDHFSNLRVGYTLDLSVEEFSVWPDAGVTVTFKGEVILGAAATMDPLAAFWRADPDPREDVGFVIFRSLGVAVSGYHDNDPSQRAISFGARGLWDEHFTKAKPIDLSGYGREQRA